MWENIFLGSLTIALCGFGMFDLYRYLDAMKMANRGCQSSQVMKRRNLWKKSLFFFVLCVVLFILIVYYSSGAKVLGLVLLIGFITYTETLIKRHIVRISEHLESLRPSGNPLMDVKKEYTLKASLANWEIVQGLRLWFGWGLLLLLFGGFFFPKFLEKIFTFMIG